MRWRLRHLILLILKFHFYEMRAARGGGVWGRHFAQKMSQNFYTRKLHKLIYGSAPKIRHFVY